MAPTRREKGKGIASTSGAPPMPKRPRSGPATHTEEVRSKQRQDPINARFRDSQAAEEFEKRFKERQIVRDRAMVLEGDDCAHPQIANSYLNRCWGRLNHIMGRGFSDLTREFYANFRRNDDPLTNNEIPYTSFLRGQDIVVSEDVLRTLMRIPDAEGEPCQYQQLLVGFAAPENSDRRQRILDVCTREGAYWELASDQSPKFIKKNMLNYEATIWCQLVLSSLLPVKHATEIVVKRMVLIYCLMEDLYVDLPSLILGEMHLAAVKKVHLPYCSIITQLARRHQINVKQVGGQPIQPEPPIDHKWVDSKVITGPVARRHAAAFTNREPLPAQPPPPPPQPTLRNIMTEMQQLKRMQLHNYAIMAKLTHKMAHSLDFDPASVLGGHSEMEDWLAAAGLPMTSTTTQPAAEDTSDSDEESQDEDAGAIPTPAEQEVATGVPAEPEAAADGMEQD